MPERARRSQAQAAPRTGTRTRTAAARAGAEGTEAFRIRRVGPPDFEAVLAVELAAFDEPRQQSRRSLHHSLTSPSQGAYLMERVTPRPKTPAGLLILLHHPRSVRVYDVAVHPAFQGRGLGRRLLEHAEKVARARGAGRMILEADPRVKGLVAMYEHLGYEVTRKLPDYYARGRHAVRMGKGL